MLEKANKFCETHQIDWRNETTVSILPPRATFFDNGKALIMILKLSV